MGYHSLEVAEYYKDIVELIRLGLNREVYSKSKSSDLSIDNLRQNYNASPERELREYLGNMDFEEIKIIQTTMYIGRDGNFGGNTPDEIYRNAREYFDKHGWNTKEIEITQIIEKIPLGKYLISALGLLQIGFVL